MSLNAALQIALSGLGTAQRAISTTANNVANVNTEGYVRKVHSQASLVLDGKGVGVQSLDAERIADPFLRRELRTQQARAATGQALDEVHQRLQASNLGDTSEGLPTTLDRLVAAVERANNRPDDVAAKSGIVSSAIDMAREIRGAANLVQAIRRDLETKIAGEVTGINDDLADLAQLNQQFTRGLPDAELADRRDQLLSRLSTRLEIRALVAENGSVSVVARSGQTLLDQSARVVHYRPAALVSVGTVFEAITVYGADQIDRLTGEPKAGEVGVEMVSDGLRRQIPPESAGAGPIRSSVTEGRLAGLLSARDGLLPELRDQLDELARGLRFTVNAAQNDAVPWPLPQTLTGARAGTADFDLATRGGTAQLALVDRSTGATVRVIPVPATATDLATMVADLDLALGADGDAALDADGRLLVTSADPAVGLAWSEGDSAVTLTDAAGRADAYGLGHFFGFQDVFVAGSSVAESLDVRDVLVADSERLATVRLQVSAGPPVTAMAGGVGDNRGLQQLAQAFERPRPVIARGDLPTGTATVGQYLGDLVGLEAVKAARAEATSRSSQALVDALNLQDGSISGVNTDEELAKLIVYQRSYTVAAQIIQTIDRLYDDLLAIGR